VVTDTRPAHVTNFVGLSATSRAGTEFQAQLLFFHNHKGPVLKGETENDADSEHLSANRLH
jgi:hypothetical protein